VRSAFNIVMRIFSTLLGLVVILAGSGWVMQGLHMGPNFLMRGLMVGDIRWTIYGAILLLLGIGQVIWSNTRGR